MNKETIATATINATNNRIISFTINRCEREYPGDGKYGDWLIYSEPIAIEDYATQLLKSLRSFEPQQKKIYYELEISLLRGDSILNNLVKYYYSIETVYSDMEGYLSNKKSIPFEELKDPIDKTRRGDVKEYKISKELNNIWRQDVKAEREGLLEAYNKIPLETKRQCKEHCRKHRASDGSKGFCDHNCYLSDKT